MSTYELAIPVVLRHEGGWVCNPKDPGGETNFGISTLIVKRIQEAGKMTDTQVEVMINATPGTLYKPGYMKTMSVEAAKKIYLSEFWGKYGYQDLNDQRVATKIFDCGVNCGPARAHTMAQVAANNCGQKLIPDGILGPASRVGINSCDPEQHLLKMKEQMEIYYKGLVAAKPELGIFLNNWLKRAAWLG